MCFKKMTLFSLILLSILLFSACSREVSATPQVADSTPAATTGVVVVADGNLVPNISARLSFPISGQVAEIVAQKGQFVEKGQVIARLEKTIELDAEVGKAQYELLSAERALELVAGRDLTPAQARVDSARLQLQMAEKNATENLELRAPFSGTIMDIDLFVGESVTPDQEVAILADLSKWYVETDNLTEIEVVNVQVGQQVSVTPDALPDLTMTGEVVSISDVFEENRGAITYTARIAILVTDPRLRWGMTVAVEFGD